MINSLNAINRSSSLVATSLNEGLSIKGQVKDVGVPIPCRVRLFEKLSGRLIYDIATNEYGEFEFTNLMNIQYFAIVADPNGDYNALIFDKLNPK
ncbi:MAG: carboxypeptidase regulatory-like domain-containing protein [Acinetobacter sp.]